MSQLPNVRDGGEHLLNTFVCVGCPGQTLGIVAHSPAEALVSVPIPKIASSPPREIARHPNARVA